MIGTLKASTCGQDPTFFLRSFSYNPTIGQFTTLDPYAGDPTNPLSYNKYLYTEADPVNGVDPTGTTVYEVSRDLDLAIPPAHHIFLLIVPDDPSYFQVGMPGYVRYQALFDDSASDIKLPHTFILHLLPFGGQVGFTIAGHNYISSDSRTAEGNQHRLRYIVNQKADVLAARQVYGASR